jgi:hypothetical protein
MPLIENLDTNFYIGNFDEVQKKELLDFFINYSNYLLDKNTPYNKKISEIKLVKIFFEMITGVSPSDSIKAYMSQNELDNMLDLYKFASPYVQSLLDPILEDLKNQLFSSPELNSKLQSA